MCGVSCRKAVFSTFGIPFISRQVIRKVNFWKISSDSETLRHPFFRDGRSELYFSVLKVSEMHRTSSVLEQVLF